MPVHDSVSVPVRLGFCALLCARPFPFDSGVTPTALGTRGHWFRLRCVFAAAALVAAVGSAVVGRVVVFSLRSVLWPRRRVFAVPRRRPLLRLDDREFASPKCARNVR